jgi:nucleotide-binding universal stress UspA family protein
VKKIVVGYDDTEGAKRALEQAAQLAKAFDAQVVVTSVAPIIASIGRSAGPIDPTDSPQKHAEELATARAYLEGQGISADYQPAVGNVGDAIIDLANEQHADLIVVGTREMGFLERLLHHSVSSEVAHRAHCDVLIVHAH